MRVIKAILAIMIAIAVLIAGNMSRTYFAFGGEEVFAIVAITYAGYQIRKIRNERTVGR